MKKLTKKEQMYNNINAHGENLNNIFNTKFDNITLCKKLFRLERKAHTAATNLCNTNTLHLSVLNKYTGYDVKQATENEIDVFFNAVRKSAVKILGEKANDILLINFDPRGYALKFKPEWVKENNIKIYQDWGGYGIVAPDFSI